MNSSEQLELDVISKLAAGFFSKKEAQQILNVSESTISRYLRGYKKRGVLFVYHGNTKGTYKRYPVKI